MVNLRMIGKIALSASVALALHNAALAADSDEKRYDAIASNVSMKPKGGIFFGAQVGATFTAASYKAVSYQPATVVRFDLGQTAPDSETGWNLGFELGYKHYFSHTWGINGYMDYIFAQSAGYREGIGFNSFNAPVLNPIFTTADVSRSTHFITLNLDFFYKMDRLGVYAGIGLGFQGSSFTSKNSTEAQKQTSGSNVLNGSETLNSGLKGGFAMPFNIGVTYDINAKNQVALKAKIPLLGYSYDYASEKFSGKPTFRTTIVSFGYSYKF